MPSFSIIVPVYNSEQYLERCINSILNQTFSDFELLLINDGSTDKSGIICNEFAQSDSRIKVFHKSNGGVSSARNTGLDNAKGDWIVFCDSDDWVLPEWLNTFFQNLCDADLIIQGMRFDKSALDDVNTPTNVAFSYRGGYSDCLDIMLCIGVVGYLMNKAFRASIIRENDIVFDKRFNFHEDEDFILKYMVNSNSAISVETVGYHYVMPNFAQKYFNVQNSIALYLSLYHSACKVSCKSRCHYREWVKNKVLQVFLEEFNSVGFLNQRKFLLEFKRMVCQDKDILFSSKTFFLTRYAIALDPTGILSSNVVRIHHLIKTLKNRR